ncbi:thioredoxin family protein [Agromyces sp. SYSU K20354]|uniref:TlpA family protein disulfide reductase n=1 Tax=Agromyces cavernae TaxID=2898659 RepID=UPI001E4A105D|nr:thioredoxin family protein [Agromyces cavernae]MCD2443774.1 thioredoxin family protein [Agromyces cavernae]
MDWLAALAVGAVLVAAATATGLLWQSRQGRAHAGSGERVRSAELGPVTFGDAATIVQFSTEFCAKCPATARLLHSIAGDAHGTRHVEIDLTRRADLARRFDVTQTPTTLLLDADGIVRARFSGAPHAHAVRAELDEILGRHHVGTQH